MEEKEPGEKRSDVIPPDPVDRLPHHPDLLKSFSVLDAQTGPILIHPTSLVSKRSPIHLYLKLKLADSRKVRYVHSLRPRAPPETSVRPTATPRGW